MKRPALRRLQRVAGLGAALMTVGLLANSSYLVAVTTPDALVGTMQQLHVGLGVALSVLLAAFVFGHFVLHRRHGNRAARQIGIVVALVAGLGCVAGGALWSVGKSSAVNWLVIVHEAAFAAALASYAVHRLWAKATPALRPERIAAGSAVVLAAAIWAVQAWMPMSTDADPVSRTPLRPGLSRAGTVDGHTLTPQDLANPEYCGQCHRSIAARWQSSAHRFASLNDPFYAATLAAAQDHRSPEQLKFCGGCHDPALLMTGRMDEHPQPTDAGADVGISCLTCHAIAQPPTLVGNGSYRLEAPQHYPGHDSPDADAREASNRLIRSKPQQHIDSFAKPHLRQARVCMPCHKAHIPAELNGHRWLAGQNEYDPWYASGAGGYSARTFFKPGPQRRCQDCHMPRVAADDPSARADGTVADHAFVGANTALPAILGDDAWLARNQALLRGAVTVDIGAVEMGAGPQSQRMLAPPSVVSVPPATPLTLDIVVRNVGSGHLFPGGIVDLRQVWLEVSLLDEQGHPLATSGWLDAEDNLDPGAHRWNSVLLDGEGRPLAIHDVEDAITVLSSRRIMLGASDVVRVALKTPATASRVEVRVLDRKFPRSYVEFALGPDAANIPVTEVASTSLVLSPGPWSVVLPGADTGPRLRNLGIGHLLRGDTALADQAATQAAERMPDDPGPAMDRARAALADGALQRAEGHLRTADALSPGHATAAWLLARVRAAQGNHPAALQALAAALAAFPDDPELHVMRAESLFRLERDDEAAAAMLRVLSIDPEHLAAHALLTRIRTEQGDAEAAAEHQAAWDRVRPQSEDRVVTERARREHPALDRRANVQYRLPLGPVAPGWRRADAQ